MRKTMAALAVLAAFGSGGLLIALTAFPDVPDDHPHRAAIEWSQQVGAFQGYEDGTFKPDLTITAEQATTVFGRVYPNGVTRAEFAALLYAGRDLLSGDSTTTTTTTTPTTTTLPVTDQGYTLTSCREAGGTLGDLLGVGADGWNRYDCTDIPVPVEAGLVKGACRLRLTLDPTDETFLGLDADGNERYDCVPHTHWRVESRTDPFTDEETLTASFRSGYRGDSIHIACLPDGKLHAAIWYTNWPYDNHLIGWLKVTYRVGKQAAVSSTGWGYYSDLEGAWTTARAKALPFARALIEAESDVFAWRVEEQSGSDSNSSPDYYAGILYGAGEAIRQVFDACGISP